MKTTLIRRLTQLMVPMLLLLTAGCIDARDDERMSDMGHPDALVGVDTFLYFTCSATGWNLNDTTRLAPTDAPGVFELSYEVSADWMRTDNCALFETNALNGWGSWQRYYKPRSRSSVSVPGSAELQPEPWTRFDVLYSEVGSYIITVDMHEGVFTIGSTDSDTENDTENDTTPSECFEGACAENATCTNTAAGFECNCDNGFTGDGFTSCTDIDECVTGAANCDPNATCYNLPGNHTCVCNWPLIGNGTVCKNVDPIYDAHCDWAAAGLTQADFSPITLGLTYNEWSTEPYHTQMTTDSIDITGQDGKRVRVFVQSDNEVVQVDLYTGGFDSTMWWWDNSPRYANSARTIDPCVSSRVPAETAITPLYISYPAEDNLPVDHQIETAFVFDTPLIANDLSQTVIFDYSSLPDDIAQMFEDPDMYNASLNTAYDAFKEYVGEDSYVLDDNGKLWITVTPSSSCGEAGNPIMHNPACIPFHDIKIGNPGWVPLHEMGHVFTLNRSYTWDYDSGELFASLVGYYAFHAGIIPSSPHDPMTKQTWIDFANSHGRVYDLLAVYILDLQDQYGYDLMKTFFRKYIASDPALTSTEQVKKQLLVQRLAESASEVNGGDMGIYTNVVNDLVGIGLPRP